MEWFHYLKSATPLSIIPVGEVASERSVRSSASSSMGYAGILAEKGFSCMFDVVRGG